MRNERSLTSMESYVEKAKGKTIVDIKDDREFQKDLIRFL